MSVEKIRRCHYDGNSAQIVSREGRNVIGEMGYISECFCTYCGISVWTWSRKSQEDAERQAVSYWNTGGYNAD